MTHDLFEPLTLPNGQILPNRIAKAAMEENMAATGQLPGRHLDTLYRTWALGGAGLLITGNVMVHDAAMTGPAGVVLDERSPLDPFRDWAIAAHSGGGRVWMQINHPGRQVKANMPGVAWGPSTNRVNTGRTSALFAEAHAMTAEHIADTVRRFVTTAVLAQETGFDGVEVHAAHGYLLSQFLSPLTNLRTDDWGGSLHNRSRLLLDIVRGIRASVRPDFAVAVKLNSADFQRGGFDSGDAAQVISWLAPLGVDLVELSGGSYESPAMTGNADEATDRRSARTAAREAYFLELATQLVDDSPLPLMVTGGVKRLPVAQEVIDSGVAVVGMATALAYRPDLPSRWRSGAADDVTLPDIRIRDRAVASAASMSRVRHQLRRLGRGATPSPRTSALLAFGADQIREILSRRRYRRWLEHRSVENQSSSLPD
ncbi:NADH:flavin oxidoreductase/NADH oxidase family protein [Corynebacterium terpenotabidum]|uniref:Oxidoreductase n=1 Tax=Corynebacterium terpenotabidum Y-11 TaxID=1200352 RepID=S4XIH3_9CORY|nr:NADH:flavin oxidoreductase/NADH oxidase family protein [Corynebacterium terpenotabidum]AGP31495.1 oxidoreductase [Corynebacterium terpenotabidum Y-11]